jgi:hypothetical protein
MRSHVEMGTWAFVDNSPTTASIEPSSLNRDLSAQRHRAKSVFTATIINGNSPALGNRPLGTF